MAAKCQCSDHVHRIREGTYRVFDKVVIIRVGIQMNRLKDCLDGLCLKS